MDKKLKFLVNVVVVLLKKWEKCL